MISFGRRNFALVAAKSVKSPAPALAGCQERTRNVRCQRAGSFVAILRQAYQRKRAVHVRRVYGLGPANVLWGDFAQIRGAEQSETLDDFRFEKLEHTDDPVATGGRQPVTIG